MLRHSLLSHLLYNSSFALHHIESDIKINCIYLKMMKLHVILLFSIMFSSQIVTSDLTELCDTTSNGDFQECLFTINATQSCEEEDSRIVNHRFSELLFKMNLERIERIEAILKNHINSMILQLYSEMLTQNICQNSTVPNPSIYTSYNLDSHIISPLESSRFISSGVFYIAGSNNTIRAWKNYSNNLNTVDGILLQGQGFDGTMYELNVGQEFGSRPVPNSGKSPRDFLTLYLNRSNKEEKTVPRIQSEDLNWRGPFLKCTNGAYLRLELELPIYALSNCTKNTTDRFTKVGIAVFEVPFSLIDFDQCMGNSTLRLENCPNNSTCRKTNLATNLTEYSYECVCEQGFFRYNSSVYSLDKTCHKCDASCFNCTSKDPCYSQVLRSILLAWNALTMLVCFILIVTTIIFSYIWKHESFVSSAPPFLLLILIGSLLMYTSLIVAYFPPSIVTCTLNAWFFYPGFSLAFGSLIIKSWRIIKLYKDSDNWSHKMKPESAIDWHLFLRLLPFIFITVISLIAWTISKNKPGVEDPKKQSVDFLYCRQDDWSYLIIVANLLLIVFGLLLSIKARTLPSRFQETRDILFSIYNITIVNAMCTLAAQTLYMYLQDVIFVILFVNLHLGITFMIFIMFRKKVWDVILEKILRRMKHKREDEGVTHERNKTLRLLDEINGLKDLVRTKQKKITELKNECIELKTVKKDQTSENPEMGPGNPEIAIIIETPDSGPENYEINPIPLYKYEKRDSATESEIHMKERNDSVSSPISSDSTD